MPIMIIINSCSILPAIGIIFPLKYLVKLTSESFGPTAFFVLKPY